MNKVPITITKQNMLRLYTTMKKKKLPNLNTTLEYLLDNARDD